MASGTPPPLRLGILNPSNALALPPIAVLAARTGWDDLWLESGDPRPSEAAAGGLSIGRIVTGQNLVDRPDSDLWLRAASRSPWVEIATLRAVTLERFRVSADAIDGEAAEEIRAAGATPVFGPAPVAALIDLLRAFGGSAAVCLPASPGRTEAEAFARLTNDPELNAEAHAAPGLVGTLEACQQTVAALREAGMTDLRIRLPATPDLPDVIAQVSALRGDALSRLRPGAPRSPDPAAPAGWGGRP
jgi:hypothetical protein